MYLVTVLDFDHFSCLEAELLRSLRVLHQLIAGRLDEGLVATCEPGLEGSQGHAIRRTMLLVVAIHVLPLLA
jgi:hypothetical protein